jgi:hypothetical protein
MFAFLGSMLKICWWVLKENLVGGCANPSEKYENQLGLFQIPSGYLT